MSASIQHLSLIHICTLAPNIVGPFREHALNNNEMFLRDFASYNNLRIMNSFFRHTDIHTFTRDAREFIDH